MAPTNCRAASRASCVSVSRVMTYLTPDRMAVSPTTSEKPIFPAASGAARSSAFRSASLPRLRS
jgi:hypothetical protein